MADDSLTAALDSLSLNKVKPVVRKGTCSTPLAVLVDSPSLLLDCINDIKDASALAVDLEGVDLCRVGRLALLQIYRNGSSSAWIVDVTVLKKEAFEAPEGTNISLKSILEDPAIRKRIYDVQLHELATREHESCGSRPRHLGFIHGLKKAIEQNLPHPGAVVLLKSKGLRLFAPELGGRYEVFEERPLAPELLAYSAQDVVVLFRLKDVMYVPAGTETRVLRESIKRVAEVKSSHYQPHGRQKAMAPSRGW